MKRIFPIIFLLAWCLMANAQNTINGYEYWFNNQYEGKTFVSVSPASTFSLNATVPTETLSEGLNSLHIRFKDAQNVYSSTLSRFFIKLPITNTPEALIIGYQYWLNNSFSEADYQALTPSNQIQMQMNIGTENLTTGLHCFNVRFKDNQNRWSIPSSRFFLKTEQMPADEKQITTFQYWLNNDFSPAIIQSVNPATQVQLISDLNITSLPDGLHCLNFRFKDNTGIWSQTISRFFIKNPIHSQSENLMQAYRYRLTPLLPPPGNNGIKNEFIFVELEEAINPLLLELNLDMSLIASGDYELDFQFKDIRGHWSSIKTDLLFKTLSPLALFQADEQQFCGDGTVSFSNQSVDAISFLWDFGDGNTSNEFEPVYTYSQLGIYNVSLTVTSSQGTSNTLTQQEFIKVFANPQPEIIADGPVEFCQGESVTLSVNMEGTLLWSDGSSESTLIVNSSETIFVLLTDENGCQGQSPDVEITVHPLPEVSINANPEPPYCQGQEVVLSATGDGAWLWSNNEQTQQITISENGSYWVQLTDVNACSAQSESLEITFHPNPMANFEFEGENLSVQFQNLSMGATNWTWEFGDGNTSNEENPMHIYATSGQYEVRLHAGSQAGCIGESIQIIDVTTNIAEHFNLQGVEIFPIPFTHHLNIRFQEPELWDGLEIWDSKGQFLTSKSNHEQNQLCILDTSQWPKGLYIIRLLRISGTASFVKVIKQ